MIQKYASKQKEVASEAGELHFREGSEAMTPCESSLGKIIFPLCAFSFQTIASKRVADAERANAINRGLRR